MTRFDYLETRETTIRLQAMRRGAATRRAVAEILAARDAATKIQTRWRARRARRAFGRLRRAAIVAQTNARAAAATRAFGRLRRAAIVVQARWRGWFARERYVDAMCAATTCQTIRRGAVARRALVKLRDAAVTCQTIRRGAVARRAAKKKVRAATEVQRAWRGFAGRRVVAEAREAEARRREAEARRRAAATTAQRHVRGWIAREAYLDVMCVTVVCQARRRGAVARRAFLNLRDAVVTCQRRRRATATAVEFRAKRAEARDDATRRASARANRAATIVQAAWRGAAGRRRAADLRDERDAARLAAKILHRRRANEETRKKAEARRREREEEETRRAAREETRRAAFEGVASRARAIAAAATLDGVASVRVRADSSSRRSTREREAATTIQARWRGWRRRVEYAVTVWATETCQAARRRVLERRRLDRRVDAERRRRLERLERDWFVRAAPAATTIQARWRGFFAREVSPDAGRLRRLRASMRASRARAKEDPSLRLDARVALAVETLHKPRKLREVREALRTLADASALCASCREAISEPRALRALLRAIRRCDRSPPHEPVLAAAYELLERLSADANGPAMALFEARDSVTVITEHMQMCRDRPELVASATRTLVNLCGNRLAPRRWRARGRFSRACEASPRS